MVLHRHRPSHVRAHEHTFNLKLIEIVQLSSVSEHGKETTPTANRFVIWNDLINCND